jgi:hypothetical protein
MNAIDQLARSIYQARLERRLPTGWEIARQTAIAAGQETASRENYNPEDDARVRWLRAIAKKRAAHPRLTRPLADPETECLLHVALGIDRAYFSHKHAAAHE